MCIGFIQFLYALDSRLRGNDYYRTRYFRVNGNPEETNQ